MISREKPAMYPRDMFIISLHHFRRIMCSTKYTLQQKDTAFGDFATDYFRCELENSDITVFEAVTKEWSMRRAWEDVKGE